MTPLAWAWLIPFLPAFGALVNLVAGHRLDRAFGRNAGAYLATGLVLVSAVLATFLLARSYDAAPVWHAPGVLAVTELERDGPLLAAELAELQRIGASAASVSAARARLQAFDHDLHALEADALIRPAQEGFPFTAEVAWFSVSGEVGLPVGVWIDPLAALLLFMVAFVCLLIHLFSIEYMAHEERFPTFFAYIGLFTAAMLAMVMSRNLFTVLLFWEVMGVMSYLLIGFFFRRTAAQQAMKKAFLVTKVGDVAFVLALAWLYREFGTLDIPALAELAPAVLAGAPLAATGIGLLLFVAAMGKSAQFPLHVWLLDAMEGPTPVSAMIHAATMVAAGVYLVARTFDVLSLGGVLPFVALVGAVTALFGALMAPAFADVKKILAWSTVSQLGLMFLSLGAFGWIGALFHLVTHAFFKALLFLCSGAMIHGSGTQDIFEMHRLKRFMPTTRWTFVIGGLSLAGIVPFAGFWSKDEMFLQLKSAAAVDAFYWPLLVVGYLTAFLTAFYIMRTYVIAFERPREPSPWAAAAWNGGALGELGMSEEETERERAAAAAARAHPSAATTPAATTAAPHAPVTEPEGAARAYDTHDPHDPHEVGLPMGTALWLLAGGATVLGLVGSPLLGNALQLFVYRGPVPHLEPLSAMWPGFLLGSAVAFAGLLFAWLLYGTRLLALPAPAPLTRALQRRLYLDRLLYAYVARPLTRLATPLATLDRRGLDAAVDGFAWIFAVLGAALRRAQTGRLEGYTLTVAIVAVVLFLAIGVAVAR